MSRIHYTMKEFEADYAALMREIRAIGKPQKPPEQLIEEQLGGGMPPPGGPADMELGMPGPNEVPETFPPM